MRPRRQNASRRPPGRHALQLLGMLVIAGVAGCATEDPIARWCTDAREYITAQAADANLLRGYADSTSSPDDRPALLRFATLGVPAGIGETRDVLGVLVGFPRIGTDHWYVFLVATVRVVSGAGFPESTDAITDVRLVGLRGENGRFDWLIGETALAATQQYVRARGAQPGERTAHRLFPGRADVFTLEVAGPIVVVIEQQSGATWRLVRPGPRKGSGLDDA